MANEISARSVEKFDGSNFQSWKFQLSNLFIANGIDDVVSGTRTRPVATETEERKTWIKDDAKAKFLMSSTMEPAQLSHVLVCTTAKEMWDKLVTVHELKSTTHKLLLTQKFHEYRMSPTDSVATHVSKVQNMARQLLDLGENMTDLTIIAKILASLPTKFKGFRSAWNSVDPQRQTVEYLEERLLEEESMLEDEFEEVTALTATMRVSGGGGAGKDAGKNGGKDSANKKKANKKPQRSKANVVCFCCQNKGHYARDCPHRSNAKTDSADYALVTTETKKDSMHSLIRRPTDDQVKQLLNADTAEIWITDSGASTHMTHHRDWFTEFRPRSDGSTVSLGDNGECKVSGEGTILVKRLVEGEWRTGRMENVLYVPGIKKNLLSVGACTRKGFQVMFKENTVMFCQKDEVYVTGVLQNNNLYRMFLQTVMQTADTQANLSATSLKCWHERLGHLNARALKQLADRQLVRGVEVNDKSSFFCDACQAGKAHRLSFSKLDEKRITKPGEMVHSDVCGPMSETSLGGARFFVTFIDDASGYRYVYFMKHKSDVFDRFKEYERAVANKFGRPIQIFRSDNGREFVNAGMIDYMKERGIKFETSAPYTPEQNGKAERSNRTVVECARTMLLASSLPRILWAEAVNTAVYLLNRVTVPESTSGKTSFEAWTGKSPKLDHVQVFGAEAFSHIPKIFSGKFDPRSSKGALVGYERDSKNYRIYDPVTKKVTISKNVVFSGELFKRPVSTSPEYVDLPDIGKDADQTGNQNSSKGKKTKPEAKKVSLAPQQADYDQPAPEDPEVEDRALSPQRVQPEGRQLRDRSKIKAPLKYQMNIAEIHTPGTYEEALSGPQSMEWSKAIEEELEAHEKNGTWTLVPRSPTRAPIKSKWVFKVIKNAKQDTPRFKARLCAKGFQQREGVDYTETFSPVVRYDSLRTLLATVALNNLELATFDVRTAFLYGNLEEEIYMEVPEGAKVNTRVVNCSIREEKCASVSGGMSANGEIVCRLRKSLYGLKQVPRCWNQRFKEFLNRFNFVTSDADKCIFVGRVHGHLMYLALYVDDGLIACESVRAIESVIVSLKDEFEITIGDGSLFVGLEIQRDRSLNSLFISQSSYTKKILEKYGMSSSKPLCVPADPCTVLRLVENDDECINDVPYREIVGSLNYLAIVSRPDLAFAVSNVSKFLNRHGKSHWNAVKRVLSYLVGTPNLGLYFCNEGNTELIGFSDADFANDLETRRSMSGYIFLLADGPVTWSSQRQKLVTMSTTESEYVAAATATKEAIWLRKLLSDIERPRASETELQIDNQSTIKLAKNAEFHKRTKHIDIRYHFLREKIEDDQISVKYVPSELQKGDIFTKALPRDRFLFLRRIIGLREPED